MKAENLFFIVGPQGAGKTTLLDRLKDDDILTEYVELCRFKFDVEPDLRIRLKICQRAIENFCYHNIAQKNPNKIIIGNRCIYDQLVFDDVYVKKRWISEEKRKELDYASRLFYHPDLLEPKAIVLNPGFDIVRENLKRRWKEKGMKWKENDWEYIKLACLGYEHLREKDNVFYIDHRIPLDEEYEINELKYWLKQSAFKEAAFA